MTTIDRERLNQLLASEGGAHLSVYLPAPLRPAEAKSDAIRVSNFARDAANALAAGWMPHQEAEAFVQPLRDLAEDERLLIDRRHGFAIFIAQDSFHMFQVDQPLPELMKVDRIFQIRPLLSSLDELISFHVLSLSKKRVALYRVTPAAVNEVPLAGVPESFEELLAGASADRGSQAHSAGNKSGATGKQSVVFHGQGGLRDAEKAELTEYLCHVDHALTAHLADSHDWLVLAGVDYETSIYRNLSAYPRIAPGSVVGNMDHLSGSELAERARPLVQTAIAGETARELDQVRQRRHQAIASDPEKVLSSAWNGQVATLYYNQDATLTGSFYPDTATLKELHKEPSGEPGDPCHDLIETAVRQTLKHGGRVRCLAPNEMPLDAKMVAALRY
jgi:hypothetical protein